MPPRVIDLDSQLDLDKDDGPVTTKTVKLFGEEWTIVCDLNFWNITTAGADAEGISRLLLGVVAEDQRADFTAAMGRVRNLTVEKLLEIVQAIMEVAAERPTKPPSASTRGATKPTSARKSVAASSRTGAKPSRR